MHSTPLSILCAGAFLCALASAKAEGDPGIFTDQGDIGTVSKPGSCVFDASRGTYTVGASGANMWFKEDAMHFVWKKVSGDVSIAADIEFVGASAQAHRKACLVIRQNLDPGSAYADVAKHGDGLTSLQFREAQGGTTKEIQSNVAAPRRVRLDKIGDTVYLSVAGGGEEPHPSGASFTLHVADPFYVGLAVSAHDDKAFETAVFSRVELGAALPGAAAPQPGLRIITLPSGDRRVADR
jgi:TolB protein